jgi:hypothetical protein
MAPRTSSSAALFIGGGVLAFVAHETGHLVANAVLGNRPRLVPLWGFGFMPFFAISPELRCTRTACQKADGRPFPGGPRGKFFIATAGFEIQHITSELILTLEPHLRCHRAPFRKGWLIFNVGLSLAYAVTSMAGIEDSHGDAGGAAHLAHLPRAVIGAALILPALLDSYRYLYGSSQWAPWISRSAKAGFVGLAFTF